MNTIINKFILLCALAALSYGCRPSQIAQPASLNNDPLYERAVLDAMAPAPDEIYKNLVYINPQNEDLIWKEIDGEQYLLVVSWKYDTTYYKPDKSGFYNTGDYQIWVTTAPELRERMRREAPQDIEMRLKQLLGLPPDAQYRYFIEFWVRPADMFRPCPDNEINDKQCGLCFSDPSDSLYVAWFNTSRIDRYYNCELDKKYPWTQLGYTYDWNPNNTSHIGLSEFVIDTDKNIIINDIYSTMEYLEGNK